MYQFAGLTATEWEKVGIENVYYERSTCIIGRAYIIVVLRGRLSPFIEAYQYIVHAPKPATKERMRIDFDKLRGGVPMRHSYGEFLTQCLQKKGRKRVSG